MSRRYILCLSAAATLGLAVLPGTAFTQEKQHVSYKTATENSKYTQQLNVQIADGSNHILRVYQTYRTYPSDPPVIGGLKLIEQTDTGIADFTEGNGNVVIYGVYVLENGDKFFDRRVAVVESPTGKQAATQVGLITGGTGKLAAMQGVVRSSTHFDLKTNTSDNQVDIAYSIGK